MATITCKELIGQYGPAGTIEALLLRTKMEGRIWMLTDGQEARVGEYFARRDIPQDAIFVYSFTTKDGERVFANYWKRNAEGAFLHHSAQVSERNLESILSAADTVGEVSRIVDDTVRYTGDIVERLSSLSIPEVNGVSTRSSELLRILDQEARKPADVEAIAAEASAEGFYSGPVKGVSAELLRLELQLLKDAASGIVSYAKKAVDGLPENDKLREAFLSELSSFYAKNEAFINEVGYNKACIGQLLSTLSETNGFSEENIKDIIYGNADSDLVQNMRTSTEKTVYSGVGNFPALEKGESIALVDDVDTRISLLETEWADIIDEGMVRNGGFSVGEHQHPAINVNNQPYHGVQQLILSLAQAARGMEGNVWMSPEQVDAFGLNRERRAAVTTIFGTGSGHIRYGESFNASVLSMPLLNEGEQKRFAHLREDRSNVKLFNEAISRYDAMRPDSSRFARTMVKLYFAIMTHTDIGRITLTEPMQSFLPTDMSPEEATSFRKDTALSLYAEMASIGSDCAKIECSMMLQMRIQAEIDSLRSVSEVTGTEQVAHSAYTREEAIEIAKQVGLEEEVTLEMDENGLTPAQALYEWDVLPIVQDAANDDDNDYSM